MHLRVRDIFTSIKTEGAILPTDLLQRIAQGDRTLDGLTPGDYHLAPGEKLNEAINRSWNRCLGAWANFRGAVAKLKENEPATTPTRERWLLPLFQELGYGRLLTAKAIHIENKDYPISHSWNDVPIHLVGCHIDLGRRVAGVAGAAKSSPHSLVQELLNRSDKHLWAFVSNGLRLRILRDNKSLTRQAFVEFDLEAMMEGESYADFSLLWLLCHESRVEADRPENCRLERWSKTAQVEGTRALDQLRNGVEGTITLLGQGFLAHPANRNLRERLQSGGLSTDDYYRQLLRLVYRLLFLFVAEDRDLLLDRKASGEARRVYVDYYSTVRLRRLAGRLRGTRHADLYQGLKLVTGKLGEDTGAPALGLPALGGFLFSNEAAPDIDECEISNRDLLDAIRALGFIADAGGRRPVDYKNLGAEEFGSVYESLLELHPVLNTDAATFELTTAGGHERKITGSYYTPTSLITSLLDTALEPVLDEAARQPDGTQEEAILSLKVCDPASGSGHFLIAAAHRIAKRLAAVRTGDEEPAPEAYQAALRDVISNSIYGVDVNPMAVELCKVNLWMESIEPGKPLTFLDHHIQCGNSLLGATPALMAGGIPDDAFKPIEGDDKAIAAKYRRRNRELRETGQQSLFDETGEAWLKLGDLASSVMGLNLISDNTIEGVREKQAQYETLVKSSSYKFGRLLADAWCAAFLWKKVETDRLRYPITEEVYRRIEENPHHIPRWMRAETERLQHQYKLFHWHIAFPDVFRIPGPGEIADNAQAGWSGGFDVVLGNPPWERIKLQEKEWFAAHRPDIANAPNAAARRRLIAALKDDDPALYEAFLEAKREAEGESHLVRVSKRYPLCGRGDINTYAIFAETKRMILSPKGRVGCIVPSGVATDDTTKYFFQDLMDSRSLVSLFDFENREKLFPAVDSRMKFCLLTLTGAARPAPSGAEFVFFALNTTHLLEDERRFTLSAEDIALVNPNTRTCPIFRSKRDAELTKSIYRRVPVLIKEGPPEENPWGISFLRMFDMANDSHLFRTGEQLETEGWALDGNVFVRARAAGKRHAADGGADADDYTEKYLPLYEAKMLHHFDHRWATYEGTETRDVALTEKQNPDFVVLPRYWVPHAEVESRLEGKWDREWLLGWRDICRSTDERTVIAGLIKLSGCGDTFLLMFPSIGESRYWLLITASLNSFILDYSARQKVGGIHIKYNIFKQLPVLTPQSYLSTKQWETTDKAHNWFTMRMQELTYSSYDLADFASDLGYTGPPFRWNEERRFLLRCELDAAYFHLYGIGREDVDYIMKTFPIVKRKDEAKYGEYRTKRVILEIYDAMAEAIKTGEPYQTVLDPPPADPRVAHPPRRAPGELAADGGLVVAGPQDDSQETASVLPFTHVAPTETEKNRTCVPLYTLRAAAGSFSGTQVVEPEGWVELPSVTRKLTEGMFVAQVVGHSMEPLIPDGSYCLFFKPVFGTREGKIVLAQHHLIHDPENGGSYTVKFYHSTKEYDEYGNWKHAEIQLKPKNPAYEPIILTNIDEGELKIIAELVEVLGQGKDFES
ncbi:MAG: S24 family peptidase [Actinomycetota bacterium]|nr:S24 family peptidase [Actinomycetota bacterium]